MAKKKQKVVVIRSPNGSISIRNIAPLPQKGSRNTNIATKPKNSTAVKLEPKYSICEGSVSITLPLRTVSEANCSEHWRLKHKRHKNQQALMALTFKPVKDKIALPCAILLTRIAPNKLNKHDNLPMSFKYIVDAVCAILTGDYRPGRADDDEDRISIAYDQIKSEEYGIKIDITF